jgi:ubiquinone/menaquinone biosynthesis C-methylase UbiE
MADYTAAFFHNTTTQRPTLPKNPSANDRTSLQSPTSPTKPAKSFSKQAKSKPTLKSESSGSSSRTSHSSHSATRFALGAIATDPYAVYTDQLTQARTNASYQSDRKPSTNTATPYSTGSSVWVGSGGNVAIVDRRYAQLTPEQKSEQRLNKARLANERAARKGPRDDHDGGGRAGSLSSTSLTGSSSSATRVSGDALSSDAFLKNPFSKRHGRRYLRDATLPYPLPCDLIELHRQIMRTMLLVQVFGGPICTSNFRNKPPKKVLEVACGTGYWSARCHQYFARQGHSVSFTGIDIAPLCPDMGKEVDMKWRFIQHDLRRMPLPFNDGEYDLVMVKDLSLVVNTTTGMQQVLMDEYLRILRPGGSLEIWDGDHTLRMLLPHVTQSTAADDSDSKDEEQERANATGTYTLTAQTPLTAPQNQYLTEYNAWISKALEQRKLTSMPCTHIRPMLLQEADLAEIESRRLAIPLGEVRWEREGVGGAITKDSSNARGNQTNSAMGKGNEAERRNLSTGQAALRRTALLTVVQKIEALEPLLREASGKGQDEWDRWQSNMMNDLMKQNGTSWGECLEVGAWWATKKGAKPAP